MFLHALYSGNRELLLKLGVSFLAFFSAQVKKHH